MDRRIVEFVVVGNVKDGESALRRIERSAIQTGTVLERTGHKWESMGASMTSLGHSLSRLSLPILAIGGYAIKSAISFQSSMTLIQTQAKASASEVSEMSGAILRIKGLGEGPNELAEALYPIESVGLRGKKALEALSAAAKGAQISGAGLTETADTLAGTLKVGFYDIHNASSAMAAMNAVVGLGKMHLNELNAALGTRVLTTAKAAGLGFRDVGAAIDSMTKQNVPAQQEATALKLTLTQMTAPTGLAERALKKVGLSQFSLANDLRKPQGLIVALRDLRFHLSRLSKDEQSLALSNIFGKSKGSSNVIGLLNALPEMETVRTELGRMGEAQLNQAFGVRQKDAAFQLAEAVGQLKKALTSLGGVLMPVVIPDLVKMAGALQSGVEWFKKLPSPLRDAAVGFGGILAVAGPTLIFLGSMTTAVGKLLPLLGKFVTTNDALAASQSAVAASAGAEAGAEAGAGGIAGLTNLGAATLGIGSAGIAYYGLHHLASKTKEVLHTTSIAAGGGGPKLGNKELLMQAAEVAKERKFHETGIPQDQAQKWEQLYWKLEAAERAKPVVHVHKHYLDGKEITGHVVTHIRDEPQHSKKITEAVRKTEQHASARAGG
jgi:TP901 family phage tail tape measure protein